MEYPLARMLGAWTLLNEHGEVVKEGVGAKALIDFLVTSTSATDPVTVLGINARTVLKGASFEVMEMGTTAGLRVPQWCWHFAPLDNSNARVYDPVDMLVSSFKEKMDDQLALQRLGLGLVPTPANPQALYCVDLARKLCLIK